MPSSTLTKWSLCREAAPSKHKCDGHFFLNSRFFSRYILCLETPALSTKRFSLTTIFGRQTMFVPEIVPIRFGLNLFVLKHACSKHKTEGVGRVHFCAERPCTNDRNKKNKNSFQDTERCKTRKML